MLGRIKLIFALLYVSLLTAMRKMRPTRWRVSHTNLEFTTCHTHEWTWFCSFFDSKSILWSLRTIKSVLCILVLCFSNRVIRLAEITVPLVQTGFTFREPKSLITCQRRIKAHERRFPNMWAVRRSVEQLSGKRTVMGLTSGATQRDAVPLTSF